jgi:hypothetical protein
MHHFGCATPSHEALEILRILADSREIADIGSGNGYWTFMLRRYGLTVHAIDNMQSQWKFLKQNQGGINLVLLLVYPIVGAGVVGGPEGGFTRSLVSAFSGDTIAVVGTQNRNGYTGFKNMTMNDYMEKENPDWVKVVQIPLPSFAGKDEALFIFQRGDRVPAVGGGEAIQGRKSL